jgi:hypothetical protein
MAKECVGDPVYQRYLATKDPHTEKVPV